ncbi:vesicle-associated membrane protein 8-like [Brachyistius frenatus]|uniref:vesicle-associated membrane protein 8-like n=1 Tax=Brachyistius frenatus TaxID=100188 RepID=UPI0037E836FA
MQQIWDRLLTNTASDKTNMDLESMAAEEAPQTKLQNLSNQVDDVTGTMKNNVEKMIHAIENADNLLAKSEKMKKDAEKLGETSERVERSYRCKNAKLIAVVVVIVGIVVLLIILLATGVIPVGAQPPTSKP